MRAYTEDLTSSLNEYERGTLKAMLERKQLTDLRDGKHDLAAAHAAGADKDEQRAARQLVIIKLCELDERIHDGLRVMANERWMRKPRFKISKVRKA